MLQSRETDMGLCFLHGSEKYQFSIANLLLSPYTRHFIFSCVVLYLLWVFVALWAIFCGLGCFSMVSVT